MELAVRVSGESGRRVLLIHGLGSNSEGWWRVGPSLVQAGFQVTAPDLRGHGGSAHIDDYSLAAYAADVAELGDDWDVVIGHSLGGSIAVTLFDQNPRFGKRLVLLDPALVVLSPEIAIDMFTAAYQAPLTAARVSADNPTWHLEDARIKAQALQQSSLSVTQQTIWHNPDWNLVSITSKLAVPTLLVGSDPALGSLVPPALGQGLADLNGLIRFVTVPESSHSMHRDEFAVLMATILEFVA
ncbi:MAG: alpha/beta hydrolase [Acidimicrobiia bacterium]|nr:alpha/beta hydrolase [Acidimicrobiia bacterium]